MCPVTETPPVRRLSSNGEVLEVSGGSPLELEGESGGLDLDGSFVPVPMTSWTPPRESFAPSPSAPQLVWTGSGPEGRGGAASGGPAAHELAASFTPLTEGAASSLRSCDSPMPRESRTDRPPVLAVPMHGVQARVPMAAETEGQAAPAEDAAIDSPSHIEANMGEAEADAFFTALLAP